MRFYATKWRHVTYTRVPRKKQPYTINVMTIATFIRRRQRLVTYVIFMSWIVFILYYVQVGFNQPIRKKHAEPDSGTSFFASVLQELTRYQHYLTLFRPFEIRATTCQ